ncbi:MAG: hypothetical protein GXC73_13010 [Chitinophagaceae bacterium]|nr:hypothetical protein [Chitinophagaceae bacterium]
MKNKLIACFLLLMFYACKDSKHRYHDGTYVHAANDASTEQRIRVDGKWMYHSLHSSKSNSKIREYKFICIQYPDKISLPLPKGHTVTVEIDKNGNLIYDGMEFKREFIRIIDPAPIPEALLESTK